MSENTKVSPAQRAQLFAQMTRQHLQCEGGIDSKELGQVKYRLNKVRLTSRVRMEVAFDLKVTHASLTTFTPHPHAPFNLISRAAVNMNNGFNPFTVSGEALYLYSLLSDYSIALNRATSGRGKVVMPLVASSSGATNKVRMLVDMPLSLNDRDPVSLIITQNQQTTVDVVLDFDASAVLLAPGQTGFTTQISNLVVTPMQESFSVPPVNEARPDIGILKLVQSTSESIAGAKTVTVKLPTGMTYRKLAWYIKDTNGVGVADSAISGNFELVLNQSDTPYVIKPSVLAAINHEQFRNTLPQGVFALDLSYQGLANYGGLRDYIDTEQLTEYWLRFQAPAAGEITVVYEQLSKLQQTF